MKTAIKTKIKDYIAGKETVSLADAYALFGNMADAFDAMRYLLAEALITATHDGVYRVGNEATTPATPASTSVTEEEMEDLIAESMDAKRLEESSSFLAQLEEIFGNLVDTTSAPSADEKSKEEGEADKQEDVRQEQEEKDDDLYDEDNDGLRLDMSDIMSQVAFESAKMGSLAARIPVRICAGDGGFDVEVSTRDSMKQVLAKLLAKQPKERMLPLFENKASYEEVSEDIGQLDTHKCKIMLADEEGMYPLRWASSLLKQERARITERIADGYKPLLVIYGMTSKEDDE